MSACDHRHMECGHVRDVDGICRAARDVEKTSWKPSRQDELQVELTDLYRKIADLEEWATFNDVSRGDIVIRIRKLVQKREASEVIAELRLAREGRIQR